MSLNKKSEKTALKQKKAVRKAHMEKLKDGHSRIYKGYRLASRVRSLYRHRNRIGEAIYGILFLIESFDDRY